MTRNDCSTRLLRLQPSVGNRSGSRDNGLHSSHDLSTVTHRDMVVEPLTLPLLRIPAFARRPGRQPRERIFHRLDLGESFDSWLRIRSASASPIAGPTATVVA